MPEVVESDGQQPGLLKERREGSLPEVGGVNERSSLRGKDETSKLVGDEPIDSSTDRL